ncbi:MAG: hypothetical protein DDT34_01352 [Firmicutes bacterium]|nr:hypothetical protein [Bacillota bacterium]
MKAPRIDLLDALAMPVLAYGEFYSPATALRAMVEGWPRPHSSAAEDGALKLAGTCLQLLGHLAGDLGQRPELDRRRFKRAIEKGAYVVPPEQLVFAPAPSAGWRPAFKTHAFLSALPGDFVLELVQLAPPVVAPLPYEPNRFAVLGNVLSGFLATRCLPGREITVRRLREPAGPRWTPTDLVAWALPRLAPIVAADRQHIAEIAPDLHVVSVITGGSLHLGLALR